MATQVEVWYDETSDASKPVWCVSLCADGGEVRCLSMHDDHAEAVDAGLLAAWKWGLHLCERGKGGGLTALA